MFKQRSSQIWVVTFFFIAALLIGCGSSPEKALLGSWSSDEGTMEFFEDGTVIVDDQLVGNYTILDESRLSIEGSFNSLLFTFEVSKNSLTLSDSTSTVVFTRGKPQGVRENSDSNNESVTVCQGPTFEATRVILTDFSGSETLVPVPTPEGADDPCMIEVTRVVSVQSIEDSMDDFIERQK